MYKLIFKLNAKLPESTRKTSSIRTAVPRGGQLGSAHCIISKIILMQVHVDITV